jgi:hypothetical protein
VRRLDLFPEIFVPRGDTIDFEPDASGLSAGTVWLRMAGQWFGFAMFYDRDNGQFDFGSDCRFTDNNSREQLRRWLLDEVERHFPAALVGPEDVA